MGASQSSGFWADLDLGEPLPQQRGTDGHNSSPWSTIHPAVYQRKRTVTVFIREFDEIEAQINAETQQFFQNGLQVLKQLRHPNVLSFVAGAYSPSECYLVTNRVFTLEYCLDSLSATEVLTGVHDVLDALKFLHNVANISHNSLCPNAVYVDCETGQWQLGAFECSVRLSDNKHWQMSDFARKMQLAEFMPPEDQELVRKEVPSHARDVYGFGKLVEFLRPSFESHLTVEKRQQLDDLIESLTKLSAKERPTIDQINADALANDLTDIKEFLRTLPEQSLVDKEEFFLGLERRLSALPAEVVSRRLGKLLLSRYVLLEPAAVQYFIRHFLTVRPDYSDTIEENEEAIDRRGIFTETQFQQNVVPELLRIFCVHDTGVRLSILQHFDVYVHALPLVVLEKKILPELLLGMKDENDEIVAASFHAMAYVVLRLGAANVTGFTHQPYFSDGRPRHVRYTATVPAASQLATVKAAMNSQLRDDDEMIMRPVSASAIKRDSSASGTSVLVQMDGGNSVTRSTSADNFDKPLQVGVLSRQEQRAVKLAERKANVDARRAQRTAEREALRGHARRSHSDLLGELTPSVTSSEADLAAVAQGLMGPKDGDTHSLLDEHKTGWSAWDEDLPEIGESVHMASLASVESILEDSKSYFPDKPESFRTPDDSPSKTKSPSKINLSPSKPKQTDTLGAEFNIAALDFSSQSDEPMRADPNEAMIDDFLSTMQPNLASLAWEDKAFERRKAVRQKAPAMASVDTQALAVAQHVANKFAIDTQTDVEAGWGDAGWADED